MLETDKHARLTHGSKQGLFILHMLRQANTSPVTLCTPVRHGYIYRLVTIRLQEKLAAVCELVSVEKCLYTWTKWTQEDSLLPGPFRAGFCCSTCLLKFLPKTSFFFLSQKQYKNLIFGTYLYKYQVLNKQISHHRMTNFFPQILYEQPSSACFILEHGTTV